MGGLLCLAIPLGVCDAESDHVFAPLMKWGADCNTVVTTLRT